MPRLEFLNEADLTDYPLRTGFRRRTSLPVWPPPDEAGSGSSSSSFLPDSCPDAGPQMPRRGLADAGFLLGPDSGYRAGRHSVLLHAYWHWEGEIGFDFRCDAPGLEFRRWRFVFPAGSRIGRTSRTVVSVPGGPEEPGSGNGFCTLGDPADILASPPGWYRLCDPPAVEPARVMSLAARGVSSLNLANVARTCPPACGQPAPAPETLTAIWPAAAGAVGTLRMRGRRNARVLSDPSRNELSIDAAVGAGDGEPCGNLLADASGVRIDGGECGDGCGDLVRSLNGVGGRNGKLPIRAGRGVIVEPDPEGRRIIVRIQAGGGAECPPS